jgi:hypothetical protein
MRGQIVKRHATVAFLAFALLSVSSCGSSMPPTAPTPRAPQISGNWLGEETVASLEGGDCLAAALRKDVVGFPGQFSGSFVQNGASVTATLDIDHTGALCNYSGAINGSSLTLDMTGCTPASGLPVSCPEGEARNLSLVAEHLTAVIDGNGISGTFAETDNVLIAGSTTSVGTLNAAGSFTLIRR